MFSHCSLVILFYIAIPDLVDWPTIDLAKAVLTEATILGCPYSPAATQLEPSLYQVGILADVYMVTRQMLCVDEFLRQNL